MPGLTSHPAGPLALSLALLCFDPAGAEAQGPAALQWDHDSTAAGFFGPLVAPITWDPDGAGPGNPVVVAAGDFRRGQFDGTSDQTFGHIATYDPITGVVDDLLGGLDGPVTAMTVSAANELVVAGSFFNAGSVLAPSVAVFDGTAWRSLGIPSFPGILAPDCRAIAALSNGDLIAGGAFGTDPRRLPIHLLRWDGTRWQGLRSDFPGPVSAIAEMPNGDLIVGGTADPMVSPFVGVARWDGQTWTDYQLSGGFQEIVEIIPIGPDSFVVAHATDLGAVGAGLPFGPGLSLWDGTSWRPAFPGLRFDTITSLHRASANRFYVSGSISEPQTNRHGSVVRLDGSPGTTPVMTIEESQPFSRDIAGVVTVGPTGSTDTLVATGDFDVLVTPDPLPPGTTSAATRASKIAVRRSSGAWESTGTDRGTVLDGSFEQSEQTADGRWIATGSFTQIAGTPTSFAEILDGQAFPFAPGLDGPIIDMAISANGDLFAIVPVPAAGPFARGLFRWDGASWNSVNVPAGRPRRLAAAAGAELYLQDGDDLFALQGGSWTTLPRVAPILPSPSFPIVDLQSAGGELHLAFQLTFNSEYVYRWNGTSWNSLGPLAPSPVWAGGLVTIEALPDGRVLATRGEELQLHEGGSWRQIASVFRNPWSSLAAKSLPNGDILLSGPAVTIQGLDSGLYRFDGTTWSDFGPRMRRSNGLGFNRGVVSFGPVEQDGLTLIGSFGAEDRGGTAIGRIRTSFPVEALQLTNSCLTPGSSLRLELDGDPWSGSTLTSRVEGLGPGTLAAVAFGGRSPATPLPFPGNGPNCLLLSDLDLVFGAPAGTGFRFRIPKLPSLVGQRFFHQGFELGPAASTLRGTDAYRLTIGSF